MNTRVLFLVLARRFYLDKGVVRHCNDTARISLLLAKELGLSLEDKLLLVQSALLHDIGKHYIPKEILNSSQKLSDLERSVVDTHSLYGYVELQTYGVSKDICDLVFLHHGVEKVCKWYDIHYLSQKAIRLHKILKVADIYSAVTTDRSYHSAVSHEEAVQIIKNCGDIPKKLVDVLDVVPLKRNKTILSISFS